MDTRLLLWELASEIQVKGIIKEPQNVVFSKIKEEILGLFKFVSHIKLLFLEIFVEKLYLKTDRNVWFAIFWPL